MKGVWDELPEEVNRYMDRKGLERYEPKCRQIGLAQVGTLVDVE